MRRRQPELLAQQVRKTGPRLCRALQRLAVDRGCEFGFHGFPAFRTARRAAVLCSRIFAAENSRPLSESSLRITSERLSPKLPPAISRDDLSSTSGAPSVAPTTRRALPSSLSIKAIAIDSAYSPVLRAPL